MVTLGVVGSRKGFTKDFVFKILDDFPNISEIISGGACGVDNFAEMYAREKQIPCRIFRPDFSQGYDVGEYFVRNRKIVDSCQQLIAFWDGQSRGTKYTIDYAKSQSKLVSVVYPLHHNMFK